EHPSAQRFTKTDLAKFENVWDEHPRWVNLGAQKNFAQYAKRIGEAWEKSSDEINELFFKRAVARAIIFKATEKIVRFAPWYNGGYRANIVSYTIAVLGEIAKRHKAHVNFQEIWRVQKVGSVLEDTILKIATAVNESLIHPPQGI